MGKKHEKHDKSSSKEKKEISEPRTTRSNAPRLCGCPVPDPVECSIGKPADDEEEGVVMECSNIHCPYVGMKIHVACFKAYEDHLVKLMSNIGSARGWTDSQRRCNLWEKKGQSLVAKVCRCRCGLGTTRRDEVILYENKLKQQVEATPTTANRKKKNKALPKLNFGVLKTSGNVDEPAKIISRNKTSSRKREVSSSTVSSVSQTYGYDYESRRESITYAAESRALSVISFNATDMDDNLSTSSRNEVFYDSQEVFPNSSPPKQTKSYACATKSSSRCDDLNTEVSIDSGVEMKSESTTGSEYCDDIQKVSNSPVHSMDHSPNSGDDEYFNDTVSGEIKFTLFESGVSTTSTPIAKQSYRSSSSLLKHCVVPQPDNSRYYSMHEETDLDMSTIPEWNIFTGSNFGIGETIIGLTALPGFHIPLMG